MNFYPGTLNPTPPDYRHRLASDPKTTREEAESFLRACKSDMDHPEDWEFEVWETPAK